MLAKTGMLLLSYDTTNVLKTPYVWTWGWAFVCYRQIGTKNADVPDLNEIYMLHI